MADGDSDSDGSFVFMSEVSSMGSDSESYVIVGKDNCLTVDSDEDLFSGIQTELKKVSDDDSYASHVCPESEDYRFCDRELQLEKNEDAETNGSKQRGIERIYCVMTRIFSLLNLRLLTQMKLVSKEWNIMVKSESVSRCVSSVFVVNLEDPGHVAAIRFNVENNFSVEKFQVTDLKSFDFPVIIIEVSTKKCWKIKEEETEDIGEYGFGYDTIDEDYKIIKVYSMETTHVAVFSQKRGSWRDLTFPHLDISFDGPGCSIEPRIYWHDTSKDSLVIFDLSKENFDMIVLPEALHNDNRMTFGVVRELTSEDAAETLLVCIYEYAEWGKKKWSELWKLTKEQRFEKLGTVVHNEGVMKPLCYHLYPMTIVVLEAKQKIKLHHIIDDSQTDIPCFDLDPRIDAIGFLDSHESLRNGGWNKGSTSELQNSESTKVNGKDGWC